MAARLATVAAALLTAAAALEFSPCPELNDQIAADFSAIEIAEFDCANVSVPLDYTEDDSETLELNIFRVNATEEPVLGNVLINFGGPGGPGATNLPTLAEQMRAIIGPQWNLVSWDPRGTGKTIPFRCSPPTGLITTTNDKRDLGNLVSINGTKGFLQYGWEFAGDIADACYDQAGDSGSATLIGTAFVARDVMQIVDALDDGNLLHYYGWSYGTALGDYIAAMFPERVGRMVLDGNVNPHDYQSGTYAHAAEDVDEAFDGFLNTCFEAQDDCSLYNLVEPDSAEDLLSTINSGLKPLAAFANTGRTSYITYVALKNGLIQPLYYPSQWPALADTITTLLNSSNPMLPNTTANGTYDEAENAVIGIRASDATFHANSSDEYLPVLRETSQVSESFSDAYYLSLWASARWRMPAKERYWGDFRAETNNPILYVNGMYDPVTPIVGAYNASSGFEGSVVLAHNGYGHGLVASPSRCASRYVQQYLQNGTLPSNGTTCESDATPLEVWRYTVQLSQNGTSNGTSNDSGNGGSGNADDDGTSSDSNSDGNDGQSSSENDSDQNAGSMAGPGALSTTFCAALFLGLVMSTL